jgi:hypothetical protein
MPEIEVKKNEKTIRTSIFRVMEPVYRFIALWGSPQRRGGRGTVKDHGSVITMYWKDNFQKLLRKKEGLK